MEELFESIINALKINKEGLDKYYPKLTDPIIKPSDFGFGSRKFFYWTDHGVIDIPKAEQGASSWIRLNLYDAIWIRIIQELRTFNTPFKDILNVKKELFTNLSDDLFSIPFETFRELYKQQYDEEEIELIRSALLELGQSSEYKAMIMKNINSTALAILLYEIILFQSNICIYFFYQDNNLQVTIKGLMLSNKELDDSLFNEQNTHLKINLNKLVGEFLTDIRFEKVNKEFGFISENEKILFDALKDKSISEINIKKDDNNNPTFRLTSTSELKDEDTILLKKILRMNDYQEVNVIHRNGKHLILKNTKKIKTTTL